jgi:RNA polymerase sigma-70 factor (ECF subfamily)
MLSGAALTDLPTQPDAAIDVPPLAERFAAGEPTAFDELVAIHQPRIARTVFRLTAWGRRGDVEDIVQEVFLAALTHRQRFRGSASLSTWLTAIAVNKCRSHVRRVSVLWRRFSQPSSKEPEAAGCMHSGDDTLSSKETAARVRSAVAALSPRDREVVVLRYFEHLSPGEIATLTRQSKNAVEVRLHRARARLAEALRGLVEEDQPR